MDNTERDQGIAQKYSKGRPASRLSIEFGLSVPHVRRILKEQGAVAGKREGRMEEDKIINPLHAKLGMRLYNFRFNKMNDVSMASDLLGWSVRKLRGIEQGKTLLTLTDIEAVAGYMQLSIGELMKDF